MGAEKTLGAIMTVAAVHERQEQEGRQRLLSALTAQFVGKRITGFNLDHYDEIRVEIEDGTSLHMGIEFPTRSCGEAVLVVNDISLDDFLHMSLVDS